MKKMTYTYPKSSFLSIEKDLGIMVNMILKNDRLKKLLYYTSKDCLDQPDLTEDQSLELFENNIKIVPKIYVDEKLLNYVLINFDTFSRNDGNPEFRDGIIEIDILCPYEQWQLKDFQLRPFKIGAELDLMFNDKHLTGIGTLEFLGAGQIDIQDTEFAGICLMYRTVHGEEDKKYSLNPSNDKDIIENFDRIFNDE